MGQNQENNEFVYLTTAPNQIIAEMWIDILKQEGIRAFFRSNSLTVYTATSFTPCRIMVTKSRLSDAAELIESIREQK